MISDPLSPATEKLYWTRPQERTFTATVTATDGQRVALDRTLFYPEGGGQPCDSGTLDWPGHTAQVSDVQKDNGRAAGETVWHTLDGQPPEVGSRVTGTLDWARRYRHSQRHTAEHLLAQAFWRVNPAFGVRSVSMRGPECTLDLAGQPGESHVLAAQNILTERLREGLTLQTVMVGADQLSAYPLRRPPQVEGEVRVVLFRDADGEVWEASACGGTHLPVGVQAAPVVILRTERVKNELTRVTFMAGEEATERLSAVYGQAQALARGFSVGMERLPERVADLQAELRAAQEAAAALRRQLAAGMLAQAEWKPMAEGRFAWLETADDLLLPVLEAAGNQPGSLSVVLAPDGSCGVASGMAEYPAQTLLKGWLAQSGGRGGGRAELARGATPQPELFRNAVLGWLDALPLPQ
ncbi:alanyl-tRNA editing protein [Deinococcus altitudinis]|uniref:alanyl-tRNA editing protein n=1 Tax=Deinococcus altitudinis TaxID=468914 RepID=UPI0038925395